MNDNLLNGVVGAVTLLVAMGCSSSGGGNGSTGAGGADGSVGPAACGQVVACGGSIVGTWNTVASCFVDGTFDASKAPPCPGATVSGATFDARGATLTFRADGTYATTMPGYETIHYTETIPPNCGIATSCGELDGALHADELVNMATCTGTDSCACDVEVIPLSTGATGTYSVSGTTITTIATTTAGGSISSSAPYCVQGSSLYLFGHDSPTATWATADGGAPGQSDPVYEVIAQKQ